MFPCNLLGFSQASQPIIEISIEPPSLLLSAENLGGRFCDGRKGSRYSTTSSISSIPRPQSMEKLIGLVLLFMGIAHSLGNTSVNNLRSRQRRIPCQHWWSEPMRNPLSDVGRANIGRFGCTYLGPISETRAHPRALLPVSPSINPEVPLTRSVSVFPASCHWILI